MVVSALVVELGATVRILIICGCHEAYLEIVPVNIPTRSRLHSAICPMRVLARVGEPRRDRCMSDDVYCKRSSLESGAPRGVGSRHR